MASRDLKMDLRAAFALRRTDPSRSVRRLRQLRQVAIRTGDRLTAISCLEALAILAISGGDLEEHVAIRRRIAREGPCFSSMVALGGAEEAIGRIAAANRAYRRALHEFAPERRDLLEAAKVAIERTKSVSKKANSR